jgi:uncharacterized protein YukE
MANMNVSYDELVNTSNTLEKGRDSIFQELDNLRNRIGNLVTSGFVTDKSSGAFDESYRKYSEGARNTVQGLDEVVSFLRKVESTLRDADAQLAGAIG